MAPSERPILVTGAAGFIGSHLCETLLHAGERVIAIDNLDPFYDPALKRANLDACARAGGDRFTFIASDIRRIDRIAPIFERERPRSVMHMAARAGVRPSIEDPVGYADVNVVGTSAVLESARRAGCDRVIVASSSSVYGNAPRAPFREDELELAPISPYAATKLACESLCHTHWHLTGMPTACLRFFTVYGPRQRPDLAIGRFLRALEAGEPITVFGDGTSSRDYTYIDDVIAGVLAADERIDDHGYRVWNLGSDRPVALRDLVEAVGRAVGASARIERAPMQPGDVSRTWADLSRARAELAYQPRTPLEEGLARQLARMR